MENYSISYSSSYLRNLAPARIMNAGLFVKSLVMGLATAFLFISPFAGVGANLIVFFLVAWLLSTAPKYTPTHALFFSLSTVPFWTHSLWSQYFIVPLVMYFCFHQVSSEKIKKLLVRHS